MEQNTSGNEGQQNQQSSSAPVQISNNTLMGILSYLGPLVIIPYAISKNDPFVKFHVKQGLVLFAIEIAMWILGMFMMYWSPFHIILQLVNLGTLILSILGIINVVQNKQAELPVVGSFSKHFTF